MPKYQNPFKLFMLLSLCLVVSCHRCQTKKEPIENQWDKAIAFAQTYLPKEGRLVQKSDGYAYVKVDDDYIHQLFPLLSVDKGYQKPAYFRRKDAPGAHISVIYKDEHIKLKEVGEKFSFTLKDVAIVHVNKSTSYIILQVSAPELEKLRQRYGLSPKLHNHEFHITLAKKVAR